MTDRLVIAKRNFETARNRRRHLDLDVSDRRGEVRADIEPGAVIPYAFGLFGLPGLPVFRETVANSRITAGVTGNSARNRDRFGNWFAYSQGGETDGLLIQQYVIFADPDPADARLANAADLLTLFVDDESLNYDGWIEAKADGNKWRNAAHHQGAGQVAGKSLRNGHAINLAAAYSAFRTGQDIFDGLYAVTGLYKGRYNFGGLPKIFVIGVSPLGLRAGDSLGAYSKRSGRSSTAPAFPPRSARR